MKNRIAIIVAWFGKLPPYFQAWLRSAEENAGIDFFLFIDQEVRSKAANIHVIRTTLEAEVARAAQELEEEVSIRGAYKFCDLRPFFGVIYRAYVSGYDFWGYCDVDLALGDVRKFLNDDVLDQYDRFYEWGHLSIFRNTHQMNRLFDLPGSIYTRAEVLRSGAKVNSEEHYGLNRICTLNHIRWYRNTDFADFVVWYSDLHLWGGPENYDKQVFYWEDGRVYQAYVDENGSVGLKEYAYIHWQKRHPAMKPDVLANDSFFITSEELIGKERGIPTREQIERLCPVLTTREREREQRRYTVRKLITFAKIPWKQKQIWLRQKRLYFRQSGYILQR